MEKQEKLVIESAKMKKEDNIAQHQIIPKGYKECRTKVSSRDLKFYKVKGIKSPIFKFQEEKKDGERFINRIILASILKSAKRKQTLDLDCSEFPNITDERFKNIWKNLRRLRGLKHLNLYLSCIDHKKKVPGFLSQCLRSLHSLQSFTLKFKSSEYITNTELKSLCQPLKKLHSLQKLNLSFRESEMITDKGIWFLQQNLKKLQKLQSCHLDFGDGSGVTDVGLDYVGQAFSKRAPLQSVGFDFTRCQKITNTGLEYIARGLPKIVSLRHLHLCFIRCQNLGDLGIQNVCRSVQTLSSLLSLDLDFRSCDKIVKETSLDETLNKLTSLRSIKLNFSYCKEMTDQVLKDIGQGLKGHPSLRKVILWFRDLPNLSHEGIQNLCKGLQTLISLEYIDIDFGRCPQIGSPEIQILSKALEGCTSLKILNLDFYNCQKVDLKMMNLENLTSLQSIHFSLGLCNISVAGMEKFGKLLEKNTSLTTLLVGFTQCDKITNLGFQKLAQGLQNLASLKKIRLFLNKCTQITDKEIKTLSQGFKKLTSLQDMELFCSGCEKITDAGFQSLIQNLPNFVFLRKIDFDFNHCDITDDGFCDFGKILQSLPLLESLSFRCSDKWSRITGAAMFEVGKTLANMISLNSIEVKVKRDDGPSPTVAEKEEFYSLFKPRVRHRAFCEWSKSGKRSDYDWIHK